MSSLGAEVNLNVNYNPKYCENTVNPTQSITKVASTATQGIFDTAAEMTNGGLEYIGNTASGAIDLAGDITSGGLKFAGQTINGTFNLLGNFFQGISNGLESSSGNVSNNLSTNSTKSLSSGQGGSALSGGLSSLGSILRGTFRGIGELSNVLSNSAMQAGNALRYASIAQSNINAARMYYNSPFGWGWGGFGGYCGLGPYGFGLTAMLNSFPPIGPGFYDPMMYNNPYIYNPYMYNSYPSYWSYDNMLPKMNVQNVDRVLYPERYNQDGSPKQTQTAESSKPVYTVDAKGQITTPKWYESILLKVEKKEPLNANEKNLKTSFEKLMREYSPYKVDKNGDLILDGQGNVQRNAFGDEIIELQTILASHSREQVETYLKSVPKEKLAAIEAHYPLLTGGRTLRSDIKECCCWYGFAWTGYNTDRFNRLMDLLDEAAMINPHNMANALNQALNNHRIWGFGVDDDRVAKLLQMASKNEEFFAAVKEQYRNLSGNLLQLDIDKKWFVSDDNKKIIDTSLK